LKKDKPKEIQETKNPEPVKCCKKSRCAIIASVVLIAGVCGVFYYCEFLVKKNVDLIVPPRIEKALEEIRGEVVQLEEEISNLKKQIEAIPIHLAEPTVNQERDEPKLKRKKWKAWMALQAKMEADEPFNEELNNFYEIFAGDEELIKLVKELAEGVRIISNENNGIADVCKNMLKKIIKLKRIDKRKLAEISGYALSSYSCGKE
jgi:predicted  nucleic acid-binding Zn-ribbon protein